MDNLGKRLFILFVGLFWASLLALRTLYTLFKVGPRKLLERRDPGNPPSELFNSVYGEHAYMNVGPIKIHYVISGPENAPLMLMVHGFPEIWFSWRNQIKEFQKDFRVVALDMRGFGDTDKPKGIQNYRIDCLVEDLRLFVDALGYKSCVVVSHDWGGAVSWAFAARHPQIVDRLVVMNIPPVPIWHQGFSSISKPVQFLHSWYIYSFQLPFLPELFMLLEDAISLNQAFQGPTSGLLLSKMTDDEVECYKYYFRKSGAMTSAINYYRANFYPPVAQHDLKYPMPLRIIWGCQDKFLTMDVLKDTLLAVPEATLTKIEKAGHFVQMDDPVNVNASIREFLASTNFEMSKK
ncbi:epoxide hydrolase 4 [Aplysia californica]|uniref:Epoxide hydrolase 4 n=1 Tax=Aplysia californica TaxID=6500 RepID=A0ABM0JUJ8_APLCA|nr:epoxide hydrolase 4 [Aplysia californica]XP_005101833.1 epoxide hydrolase 4 [Aplysia californica]